ncbi:MAG: hypothetical protein ACYC0V_19555, partial [Armatimonadota bacterium]
MARAHGSNPGDDPVETQCLRLLTTPLRIRGIGNQSGCGRSSVSFHSFESQFRRPRYPPGFRGAARNDIARDVRRGRVGLALQVTFLDSRSGSGMTSRGMW